MITLDTMVEKIDSLSIRERGVLLIGILFVLYTLWDSFLMRPIDMEQRKIKADLQQKQVTQAALNMKLQVLIEQSHIDPNAENRERLTALKTRLKEIETTMDSSTADLVSPKNMATILETVLHKTKGLSLREVRGLGKSPLIGQEVSGNGKKPNAKEDVPAAVSTAESAGLESAYKHGLKIEFEGDYMTTLDYLRDLESLEWRFLWDSFEFQVEEYPRARASITVFTLSLDQNWIGV